MRRRVRMPRLPSLEPGERIILASCPRDLDQRVHRNAPSSRRRLTSRRRYYAPRARRLHARRLAWLLTILRGPRRIAEAVALITRREIEERFERAYPEIDSGMPIANLGKPPRHGRHREVTRSAALNFIPRDWRRYTRIGLRPNRVRRC